MHVEIDRNRQEVTGTPSSGALILFRVFALRSSNSAAARGSIPSSCVAGMTLEVSVDEAGLSTWIHRCGQMLSVPLFVHIILRNESDPKIYSRIHLPFGLFKHQQAQ